MTTDISTSSQIAWVLEAKIKAGKRPDMEAVIQDAIAATSADPEATNYEFFLDGDVLHVFEKYTDSPATAAHLA